MEFRDIARALQRNLALILIIIVASVAVAIAYCTVTRPTYEATTKILFSVQSTGGVSDVVSGNAFLVQRIQTLVPLAETQLILQPAIDALGLDATPDQIASYVTVLIEGVGTTISVTAGSSDPTAAVALSTAVSDSLVSQITQFDANPEVDTTSFSANVVAPAVAPSSPSNPNWPLSIGIAFAVGIAVAAGVVALRTATDTRIRSRAEAETTVARVPVLGGIASSRRPRLDMLTAPTSDVSESYRLARANLVHRFVNMPAVSLLVTSPHAGDGKTTVAANLALALAESGETVTIVDADLRGSQLAALLGLRPSPGLSDVLKGTVEVGAAIQNWGDTGIRVLVAGTPAPNASELLGTPVVDSVLNSLSTRGGIVIVDAPATAPYADAIVLSEKARGVLVVTRAGSTKKRDYAQSVAAVEAVNGDVLGTILTHVPRQGPDAFGR